MKSKVIADAKKYSKYDFEMFWKEYVDKVNEQREKRSRIYRFFIGSKNPILEHEHIKILAGLFYEYGQLQMVSGLNQKNVESDLREDK